MGRMPDYTIRPKPNSWPSPPNEAEYSAELRPNIASSAKKIWK